jgi:hypothetical protein
MYYAVKKVQAIENYFLNLIFETGEEKIFDMKPYLNRGIFKELLDVELFKKVHISFDTIEWENGVDLDPEVLYEMGLSIKK